MIIRHAVYSDLDAVSGIELACFGERFAIPRDAFDERLRAAPELFWLAEEDGKVAAMLTGCFSSKRDLEDDMYFHDRNEPNGSWLILTSLATTEEFRRRGFAAELLNAAIKAALSANAEGVVLTCVEEKFPYYRRFGFVEEGVSKSNLGGIPWYQMRITF